MSDPGLRERKKQRMYETVSDIAVRLFMEKGFDAVSVAEVAAAAEISKPGTTGAHEGRRRSWIFRASASSSSSTALSSDCR